jgi:putative addiction module component (TIGR02574 family)
VAITVTVIIFFKSGSRIKYMKIQELSVSERIVLAEMLWDSVKEERVLIELPEKQKIELDKRLQLFLDDQDVGASWDDVKSRIIANA